MFKRIVKLIISDGLKPGPGQFLKDEKDIMHNGKKIGIGVYCEHNPEDLEDHAGTVEINGTET